MTPAGQPARAGWDPVPRGQGHELLTAAAREIFAERGYHGTSIREIARRAGLSLSALYYWHESKQDLLADVLLESRHDYLQTCHTALAAAPGSAAAVRLGALVTATIDYRIRRRLESVITTREWANLSPEHVEALERLRHDATALWVGVVDAGVASGEFGCPYPHDARRAVEAACNAVAQWYDPDGEITAQALIERYTAIALRMVDYRPAVTAT